MMLCDETKPSLSAYLDDCLSQPVRLAVEEHLDRCPVCRAELAQLRSLTRSLSNLDRPVPPADLALNINDALLIEAAAMRQTASQRPLSARLALWLEPKLMPYTVGSFASVILFIGMFAGLRPHFVALREAAASQAVTVVEFAPFAGYDINQPVSPEMLSAQRAPYGAQSPSLNPSGALAALTSAYVNQATDPQDPDDMIVIADVFSNGAASLADVVHAPRDPRMLDEFAVALRQNAAFVPASMDRRPDTMRVVFAVQKVDVRDRNF
jgi:anti-sigma factor RsiW